MAADLPELPAPYVTVRGPNGQRYKPAKARIRDGRLIVWAQVGRVVERVAEAVIVSGELKAVNDVRLTDDAEGVWQIGKAACGCGAKSLVRFDPDVEDP